VFVERKLQYAHTEGFAKGASNAIAVFEINPNAFHGFRRDGKKK
jgi:hypothetical protein